MILTDPALKIERVEHSRISEVDFNNIPFGRIFSDHMLVCDYVDGEWQDAVIQPYQNLSLSPACSGLHYGQSIFEGMKANRDMETGEILLFRPDENAKRLYDSAQRMCMPPFDPQLFVHCLKELINLDRNWVPNQEDSALYIRPLMFANDNYIGVKAAYNYKLVIFTSPVGAYYAAPVKVWIEDRYVRAFPGGTGDVKAAGNYGPTLYPAKLAKKRGYDQILWTDAYEHKYVEEIGTMNVFFQIDGKVYTPKLESSILPGITRESVMQLIREEGVEVIEKRLSVDEIFAACEKGTLQDAFGTGTAATISHIANLGYKEFDHELPPIAERTLSNKIKQQLEDIKRGRTADVNGWIVRV